MTPGDRWAALPPPVQFILIAAAYYLSAQLGLRLALVDDIVTPLWPPTGVAVVTLTAIGARYAPAIFVAAFAVNVALADAVATAALIAVGNTLAPLTGAVMLRRLEFDRHLGRLRDAVALVAVALVSMTISATVGTVAVAGDTSARVIDTWWVWWAGDAMGVLTVAPFLWSLARARWGRPDRGRAAEAMLLFVALGVLCYAAAQTPVLFVVLPLVGWIAWRFQQPGAAPAGLLTAVIVVLAAANDNGIFEGEPLLRQMELIQAFNASVALTSFVFAAAVTERRAFLHALYQREHHIAETLQRSLLPELPSVPGASVGACYYPASQETQVAGDWYDVIPLADHKLVLVVGDVTGHGLSAAAAMAQLRMGLRAYARTGIGPAATLEALNRLAVELHPGVMATALCIEYDPEAGELLCASAGHPPPLIVNELGERSFGTAASAVPIGVASDLAVTETRQPLPEGSTVVMFTDGLVERRDASLDEGLDRLARAFPDDAGNAQDVCDRLIAALVTGRAGDDVAILTMRPTSLAGEALLLRKPADPATVAEVRRLVRRWLSANGADEGEAYDILVALSEAHTNAVQHAYHRTGGVVEIEVRMDVRDVVIVVRDRGTRRDTSTDGEHESRGRGLPIIRTLTDAQVVGNERGTEVRMRRQLRSTPRQLSN